MDVHLAITLTTWLPQLQFELENNLDLNFGIEVNLQWAHLACRTSFRTRHNGIEYDKLDLFDLYSIQTYYSWFYS